LSEMPVPGSRSADVPHRDRGRGRNWWKSRRHCDLADLFRNGTRSRNTEHLPVLSSFAGSPTILLAGTPDSSRLSLPI